LGADQKSRGPSKKRNEAKVDLTTWGGAEGYGKSGKK